MIHHSARRVTFIIGLAVLLGSIILLWLYFQRPLFSASTGTDIIVFSRGDELGHQLYATTADGSQHTRITENIDRIAWWLPIPNPFGSVTTNVRPSSLPGTNDVMFFSTYGDKNEERLYQVSIDGRNMRPITTVGGRGVNGYASPNLDKTARIDFDGALHISQLDGSFDLCITCILPEHVYSFVWSLDSQQIAFSTSEQIYLVDVNGKYLRRLTPAGINAIEPAWSTDNTRIAFASKINDHYHIFVIRTDGTQLRQVTFDPKFYSNPITSDRQPTWAPDDTHIAFVSTRDGPAEIYTTNLVTSQVHRVTMLGNVSDLVWIVVKEKPN